MTDLQIILPQLIPNKINFLLCEKLIFKINVIQTTISIIIRLTGIFPKQAIKKVEIKLNNGLKRSKMVIFQFLNIKKS